MADSLARGQRAVFLEHHRLFHQTIFDASGAPRLGRLLANLLESAERYEQLELSEDVLHADELAHHAELLDLLRRGDGKHAASRYKHSFLAHGEDVIRRLAGDPANAD